MKKILILGGSDNQVKLIKAAKKEGYYVVLCDYTQTNPGIKMVDKHYQVSTLDKEEVLKVAIKEKVDGVISNSEPAMENVAIIAEELGLVGNPLKSIQILLSKDEFRNVQKKVGLFAPKHFITCNEKEYYEYLKNSKYPLIIKPVLSSGSRGTTKLEKYDKKKAQEAFNNCREFSRNSCCSIEEYVPSMIDYVIEGDVFVYNDDYFWDGMFYNYRHKDFKMIPTTESWPLTINQDILDNIKNAIKKLFRELKITFGEYNIEMYLNENNELFIIEINPRQGGYDIPDSIKKATGIDFSRLLVTLAVKDETYFKECLNKERKPILFTRHVLFSLESGIFDGVYLDDKIKDYVKKIEYVVPLGTKIRKCQNASDLLGFLDIVFDTYENQKKYDFELEKYIKPIVRKDKND